MGVALAGITLAGCGVAGPQSRTFVGPVTIINQTRVCVGGPDASGECFVKDRLTRNLHVSDCVRVTYLLQGSARPSTASRIEHLDAAIGNLESVNYS
jgi:hypothetical protein